MAKIDDVERRLLNWARWRIGGDSGGLGYASATLGMSTQGRAMYREAIVPTSASEAVETDNAVQQLLDLDHRRVVLLHYAEGLSVAGVSIRLDCSVATVYARIDRLHRQLDEAFRELAAKRGSERARVEWLQRQARPKGEF